MGADLYRKSETNNEQLLREQRMDELYEVYQATGTDEARQAWLDAYDAAYSEGWYFRDSYNNSNLLRHLGLDWWRDLESLLGPNGDGVMTKGEYGLLYPPGMRKFIVEIESRRDAFHKAIARMSVKDQDYFRDKLSRLTGFLHDAAEAGDTIYCSV